LVAVSTCHADEKLLVAYLNSKHYDRNNSRTIIVPHEINKKHIQKLIQSINHKAIIYSDYLNNNDIECNVLIIDRIGLLLSIYQYAYIAYIGGGFGKGIHNILEASAYGIPVVFGEKYHKFNEAKQLVNRGGAFSISKDVELFSIFDKLFNNTNYYSYTADIAKEYVNENVGASQKIFDYLENLDVFNKY
jgi:3-deoxy-D-manno-octulosonic-acid transferase